MNKFLRNIAVGAAVILSAPVGLAEEPSLSLASPGWRTYQFVCCADNVNVRTGPGTQFPVATDEWGNKITLSSGEKRMGVTDPNSDWIDISQSLDDPRYVSDKFLAPVMTRGFEEGKNLVYVTAYYKEPEDDETGCWVPSLNTLYIWDDGTVAKFENGFEDLFQFGHVVNNMIEWDYRVVSFELLPFDNPKGLSINSWPRDDGWERMKIYTGEDTSVKAKGLLPPDCPYFGDVPYLILFTPDEMVDIIEKAKKVGLLESPIGDYSTIEEEYYDNQGEHDYQGSFTFTRNPK